MLCSMKAFTLTEAQTNELRRAHRAAKNKKDADKLKAVYLLSRGKTPQEIAEVLMLDIYPFNLKVLDLSSENHH